MAVILAGYWALFAFWPLPPTGYDYAAVGVSPEFAQQHNFTGFAAHWNMNANPAHYFDVWFLNLFPRESPFTHNGGGYQTLSFIPSLATMVLGLLAGELIRGRHGKGMKFLWLLVWGGVCLASGLLLDRTGLCPIVKRIWTPAWTLYSGGWAFISLALLYGLMDGIGIRFWAWPGVVVGLNSIAMYVMSKLLPGWIDRTIRGLCGPGVYGVFDQALPAAAGPEQVIHYGPIVETTSVLFVLWCFCVVMYRAKWFIRI